MNSWEIFLESIQKGRFLAPLSNSYKVQVSYKTFICIQSLQSVYSSKAVFGCQWMTIACHLYKPTTSKTCWCSVNNTYLLGNWIWDCFVFQNACHKVNLANKSGLVVHFCIYFLNFCNYIIFILEIRMWERLQQWLTSLNDSNCNTHPRTAKG